MRILSLLWLLAVPLQEKETPPVTIPIKGLVAG